MIKKRRRGMSETIGGRRHTGFGMRWHRAFRLLALSFAQEKLVVVVVSPVAAESASSLATDFKEKEEK